MDERLLRPQFGQMKLSEKLSLMKKLSFQYGMHFKELYAFSRWGQGLTTGVFEKAGREFVFVPGDTVTLGWDGFAAGIDKKTNAELKEALTEFGYKGAIEDFLRPSMTPVRQVTIGPILVSRKLEEIGWEPIAADSPRLEACPDWVEDREAFVDSGNQSLIIHKQIRFERVGDGRQAALYHEVTYAQLRQILDQQGLSLPTADEWEYLCGGGCRTLFPWGDSFDYSMHLYHYEMHRDIRPYDMEEPNFFGLSIAYDPYKREVLEADAPAFKGGDGGCNICGGLGPVLGFLPCAPYYKTDAPHDEDLNGDYDFIRPIIRITENG